MTELETLALKIADSCARSDIECNCPWVSEGDEGVAGEIARGEPWYDSSAPTDGIGGVEEPTPEWLTDALRYLELRGMLVRKEGSPRLVRVIECTNRNSSEKT